MAGNLYGGDLYFNLVNPVTGLKSGWTNKIYTGKLLLQTQGQLKELLSLGRDDYNQVIGAVSDPQPAELGFSLRDLNLDAYKMVWLATQSAYSQSNAAVTDETINFRVGYAGKTVKRNISATVLTSKPAGTNYVLGTDYTVVNARLGLIMPVPGSSLATAIAAADPNVGLDCFIDYTPATIAGAQLAGGAQPSITGEILFDGKNRESGKPIVVEVPSAVITPSSAVNLLDPNFIEADFTARMKTVAPYTSPFVAIFPEN